MKIYIAHSSAFDFEHELYEPIRKQFGSGKHTFILPHEGESFDSKKAISECDLMIVEASYPSTGMGIELGWASGLGKPIACVYKAGSEPLSSLKYVCKLRMKYATSAELVSHIQLMITAVPIDDESSIAM